MNRPVIQRVLPLGNSGFTSSSQNFPKWSGLGRNQEYMNEIRSQAWVACFENAFMELEAKTLNERIDRAEAAIDARLFALRNDSDHHEERELIFDAIRALRSLRHTK